MSNDDAYRRLFDSHPVAMAIWDPTSGRILAINDAAEKQYGYRREAATGLTVEHLVHPDDWARLRERLATMPPGHVSGDTYRHGRRDGSVRAVAMTGHDRDFEGRPARVVMALDVTERRILEEQLRQAQRMEAVGQLAGGIAHDFNNLLMIINGFGELLAERITEGDEREAVEQIRIAGDRAATLTRQLLEFAEPGMRQPELIDAGVLVRDLLPSLRQIVGQTVRVGVESPAVPVWIEMDRDQLERILVNLVTNARDAMSAGGMLGVTVEEASADLAGTLDAAPGAVVLSVSDSGPGIPTEDRERVFVPFFTTRADRGGTGLGLALVFALVRGAGGRVWVERGVPGAGTIVRVLLPLADPGRPTSAPG